MRFSRMRAGIVVSVAGSALVLAASSSAATTKVQLKGSASPAASRTPQVGSVSPSTAVDFEVQLKLPDQAGAEAFARSVSTPGSATYRKYLTPAQWEARFSPTQSSVDQVKAFLAQSGFSVGGVSADRTTVQATGTAQQIERAFGTSLGLHKVHGLTLRLAAGSLSVPSSVAGIVGGVTGVSEAPAQPAALTGASPQAAGGGGSGVKPPAGFRNAQPCGTYYGQVTATSFPALPGFPSNPPYAPCGYKPPQIRSAYGLTGAGNGAGTTVAIVDAYASPTIFADAHQYASLNDPSNPLQSSQFSQMNASSFKQGGYCASPNGWWGEETLDVEAVHTTAPGAKILYAGAASCSTDELNNTLRTIVDNHLADVVSNSYADTAGDLLDSANDRQSTDDILMMAAGTGVSMLFSSGDDGDDYDLVGTASPEYPASSPWATAAGGTTLQVGSTGSRTGEYGWSTGISTFCNQDAVTAKACASSQLGTWGPLTYDYGAGGGTSYVYGQPSYQAGIVPASLSELRGSAPMRVVPDISMDADPSTGLLVGETQTFPDGVYYDQYRIGGTSLASPLLAGVVARADQAAGRPVGFLNPLLYGMSGQRADVDDIVSPASPQDMIRSDYFNSVDASGGYEYSARTIDDQGTETYCASTNKCTTVPVSLKTTPGYDNMTGLGSPAAGFVGALAAGK